MTAGLAVVVMDICLCDSPIGHEHALWSCQKPRRSADTAEDYPDDRKSLQQALQHHCSATGSASTHTTSFRLRRQPWPPTPMRGTTQCQQNWTHHHGADSAPGSKAPALRDVRQQPAGSKAPPRSQRTLSHCAANLHRLDNWINAALAWQSTLE